MPHSAQLRKPDAIQQEQIGWRVAAASHPYKLQPSVQLRLVWHRVQRRRRAARRRTCSIKQGTLHMRGVFGTGKYTARSVQRVELQRIRVAQRVVLGGEHPRIASMQRLNHDDLHLHKLRPAALTLQSAICNLALPPFPKDLADLLRQLEHIKGFHNIAARANRQPMLYLDLLRLRRQKDHWQ